MFLLNPRNSWSASWPVLAVYLLYGYGLVQDVFIVNRTGLDNLHASERLRLDPHDGTAIRAIVVRNILAAITFANERTVGT